MKTKHRELATTLRKVAADLTALKAQRKKTKLEKCAAILVARVGLDTLKKQLLNNRR